MTKTILLYGSRSSLIEAVKNLTPKLLITSDFKFAEAVIQDFDFIHIYDDPLILVKSLELIIPQNINYIVVDLQGFTSLNYDLAVNIARKAINILKGVCIVKRIKLITLSPARAKIKIGEPGPALPIHDLNDEVVKVNT